MIRRALRLRPYIEQVLLKFKQEWEQENKKKDGTISKAKMKKIPRFLKEENQLNSADWAVLEHLVIILGFYENTLKQLEGDGQIRRRKGGFEGSYGNIWEVLDCFEFMLGKLEYYKQVAVDHPDPEQFRIGLNLAWEKLDNYYGKLSETPIYYGVLALHPAFRWGWFERTWVDKPQWIRTAKQLVQDVWNNQYRGVEVEEPRPRQQKRPKLFLNPFEEHLHRARSSTPAIKHSPVNSPASSSFSPTPDPTYDEYELWQRSAEPTDCEVIDPLGYWNERQNRYPRLSKMALDFLTVQSMSAECERLFSAAGRMVTKFRSNLDAEVISMCQVLRSWYRVGLANDLDPLFISTIEEAQFQELAAMEEEQAAKKAVGWLYCGDEEENKEVEVVETVEEDEDFV
jgi:hypothetical protein